MERERGGERDRDDTKSETEKDRETGKHANAGIKRT